MADDMKLSTAVGLVRDTDDDIQHRARLAVAYHSRNREDGLMLLDVLGLLPTTPEEIQP